MVLNPLDIEVTKYNLHENHKTLNFESRGQNGGVMFVLKMRRKNYYRHGFFIASSCIFDDNMHLRNDIHQGIKGGDW